jgi:hypothetical protein
MEVVGVYGLGFGLVCILSSPIVFSTPQAEQYSAEME